MHEAQDEWCAGIQLPGFMEGAPYSVAPQYILYSVIWNPASTVGSFPIETRAYEQLAGTGY